MKFQFTQININPSFPICPAGFIQQTKPIFNIHDDLHARIMAFEDDRMKIYLISCDNLGLPITLQNELQTRLQKNYNKHVFVTISSTHTHFAPTPDNADYRNELLEKLENACQNLVLEDGTYEISYQREFFDGLGTSRISHHKADHIYLQLLSIYKNNKRIAVLITHNVHPTIHNGDTPYFTAEYPGYVLQKCFQKHPETAFTFMQGADGDISTRFTRPSQDWDGMCFLANKLYNKIEEMLLFEPKRKPLVHLDYESILFPLKHEFNEIDTSSLPNDLTPRELETIQIGIEVRKELSKDLDSLPKKIVLSKVQLGDYRLIFSPNELFSSYNNYINLDTSILVCYSNGYSRYVSGINDDFITYETFTDTLTKDCKKEYATHLKHLSND